MNSHNFQVALKWANVGVPVFPVEITISASGIAKKPRVKWRDQSTTDRETIEAWWKAWPDSAPGIDLAKAGIIILDGDKHAGAPDGAAALNKLFADHRLNISAIPMVVTPQNGGLHAWFKQPTDGEPLGNSDRAVRDKAINVRGSGGFCVAPGTLLADGRRYQRLDGTPSTIESFIHGTIPVLPPTLAALLRSKPNGHDKEAASQPKVNGHNFHSTSVREEAYALATLDGLANDLAAMAPETGRNIALNNAAMRLGHAVAAGWIGRAIVEGRLFDASVTNGLVKDTSPYAARATIKSGLDAGEKEPAAPLQDREDSRASGANRADHSSAKEREPNAETKAEANDHASSGDDYILVQAGALHEIATKGEQALIAAGAPLYARGGEIVCPIIEEVAAFKGRKTKVTRLKPLTVDMLRDHLSQATRWGKCDGRKGKVVAADPPADVARIILARDGKWKFSKLTGIITTPTLRPDGSILSELPAAPCRSCRCTPTRHRRPEAAKVICLIWRLLLQPARSPPSLLPVARKRKPKSASVPN
jgi:hypothetical protein